MESVLKENHDNLGLSEIVISTVVKFINTTLQIDPDNRPTIPEMLKYLQKF